VGLQGSLLISLGLHPIRLNSITVGSVLDIFSPDDVKIIREDAERAFSGRLQGCELNGKNDVYNSFLTVYKNPNPPTSTIDISNFVPHERHCS
jgi:hypothetical protein